MAQNVSLTNLQDLDVMILLNLDEEDLNNMCNVNRYFTDICNNDDFWRLKIDRDFPGSNDFKPSDMLYRDYYVMASTSYPYDPRVADKITNFYKRVIRYDDSLGMRLVDIDRFVDVSDMDIATGNGIRTSTYIPSSHKFYASGIPIISADFNRYAIAIQALNGPGKLMPHSQDAIAEAKEYFGI